MEMRLIDVWIGTNLCMVRDIPTAELTANYIGVLA